MVTFGFPKDFLFVVGYLPSNDAIYAQSSLLSEQNQLPRTSRNAEVVIAKETSLGYLVNNQFSVFR
jgi:hypothetical protein